MEQQEHVRAYYDEDDASRRMKTFANAVFTIPSNSTDEMAPFEGPLADALPSKAHLQRLESGAVAKVRGRELIDPCAPQLALELTPACPAEDVAHLCHAATRCWPAAERGGCGCTRSDRGWGRCDDEDEPQHWSADASCG